MPNDLLPTAPAPDEKTRGRAIAAAMTGRIIRRRYETSEPLNSVNAVLTTTSITSAKRE